MTAVLLLVAVALAVGVVVVLRALRQAQTDAAAAKAQAETLRTTVDALERQLAPAPEPATVATPTPTPASDAATADADAVQALTDQATGLFNEEFFRVTLDTRVSAARRHLRPVAVVLLEVAEGVKEGTSSMAAPMVVAGGIRVTLRDADTACRLDDGRFALILEDTPENGAVWTVERIRRALAVEHPNQTLWAGIACYPAHAFDAWGLFERSSQALIAAREWHQDRIEVATAD
jgi:diguanylate cyclase (GGDEF)-like protein